MIFIFSFEGIREFYIFCLKKLTIFEFFCRSNSRFLYLFKKNHDFYIFLITNFLFFFDIQLAGWAGWRGGGGQLRRGSLVAWRDQLWKILTTTLPAKRVRQTFNMFGRLDMLPYISMCCVCFKCIGRAQVYTPCWGGIRPPKRAVANAFQGGIQPPPVLSACRLP